MKQALPNTDFSVIRPYRGKQSDGFEELSVQLFRAETKGQGEFYRIEGAGGDGGVEAYRELPTGEKIALQSKYFRTLSDTQWRQLTKSVKSALKNHPELCRYIISTPLDRPPAQVTKWKKLKKEWLKHAVSLGISHTIEFIWWGHSELTELLGSANYRDQLVYWFGLPEFEIEWLNSINLSNIALLGKRYSPKQHVETDSGVRLEAFAWGDKGKSRIVDAFLQVGEKWRAVDRRTLARAKTNPESKDLTESLGETMRDLLKFRWPDCGYPKIRPASENCRTAIDACSELEWKLRRLNQEEKENEGKNSRKSGPYEALIYDLHHLEEALTNFRRETEACQTADEKKLLLLGEAGSGKSHLIADLIDSSSSRKQPTLLLLGEQFLDSGDPWKAATEVLGWNHSPDDLLAALDQEAILAGRPAVLCIDALNESTHRQLWQSHLIRFAERIFPYPHVKLLISCRSDFARITLPEAIRPGADTAWSALDHRGFGSEVVEAIEHYFAAFNVRSAYFPPALAEFRNPLFLRVFCEAFEGQELPDGPLSLDRVMRARVDRLGVQIQKEIDCDPEDTRSALQAIAAKIAANGGRPISRKAARNITLEEFPNRDASSALYGRLLSNGMLVETISFSPGESEEQEVLVRFPFERFSDYFIAVQIIQGVETKEQFSTLFEDSSQLAFYRDHMQYYESRGVARALAILAPERLNIELADILTESSIRELVLEDFLESLAWRSTVSFSSASDAILDEARENRIDLFPTYLRVSTIPQHPFNSEFLSNRLANFTLPEREVAWTLPVTDFSRWDDENVLGDFLNWCFRAPTRLVSDEQAQLAGRLLIWLCSSNHRALRKRSTIAAIRLLVGRPSVVSQLVSELSSVDDPYVIEQLYAVAAGVAVRPANGNELAGLASVVHEKVFRIAHVTPNILIRDFASTVLEACLAKGCLPDYLAPETFRPPFVTEWPTTLSNEEVKRFEDDESWRTIVSSVRSEGMGGYGDFGRYVMDAKVHYFSDKRLTEPSPDAEHRGRFPGTTTRRWILQRIEELGWTGERFGEFEKHVPHGRQSHDVEESKIERISKKYQWIALHEYLGFLSDHYWLDRSWRDELRLYSGAWQISARDFDPSQRLVDIGEDNLQAERDKQRWGSGYPNPFQDTSLCNDREAWITRHPDDFAVILAPKKDTPDTNLNWLTLAGHGEWEEPEYDRVIGGRKGRLRMWANVRSFLVKTEDHSQFKAEASKKHFYGRGCEFPEIRDGWIGEYPWGAAFSELKEWCESPDERVGEVGVPYSITACDWNGGSTLVPSPQLCELLDLEWTGQGGAFEPASGESVMGYLGGEAADWGRPLLVRQDLLTSALRSMGLTLVWCVLAERSCWCSETTSHPVQKNLEVSALYSLKCDSIDGGLTQTVVQNFRSF